MKEKEGSFIIFSRSLIVGGVAAGVSKTAVAPIERIKLILQVQASHPDIPPEKAYSGILNCAYRLWADQPKTRSIFVKTLPYWRGNTANVLRYFPMQAINFASKSRIRNLFYDDSKIYKFWGEMWRSCLSGGLAGIIGLTVVYPLDFARTRMSSDVSHGGKYNGLLDCCAKSFKQGGIQALYKGFAVSVCGIFPYRAAYFGFYDVAKKYAMNNEPEKCSFLFKFAISQTTSIFSQIIAYPHDTVRRRLMTDVSGKNRIYKGGVDCFFKILREEGVLAFFRGAGANAIRATGCALCLVFYDSVGRFLFLDKDFGGH